MFYLCIISMKIICNKNKIVAKCANFVTVNQRHIEIVLKPINGVSFWSLLKLMLLIKSGIKFIFICSKDFKKKESKSQIQLIYDRTKRIIMM